jgi:DNA-binding CsgD family transcriptional regulator
MSQFNEMVEKYTIKVDRKIKKICAPLVDCLSIPIFSFFIVNADGTFGNLSNYPENLDFFYAQKLFHNFPYMVHPSLLRTGCVLTDCHLERFKMTHLFLIVQNYGTYIEGCGFAITGSLNTSYPNFFPKLRMLQIFISYFKREAAPIIKNMMQDGYNIFTERQDAFFQVDPSLPLANTNSDVQRFLKMTSPLSKREIECLDLFKQGMSAQATASHLGLSQRTVEHYLDRIKEKLGCSSKWDLLKW